MRGLKPFWLSFEKQRVKRIITLYKKGNSILEIGRREGVSRKPIEKLLRDKKIKVRDREFYRLRGEAHKSWKGGRIIERPEGYILVYAPNHPYRTKARRVREHRLVMEKYLGRYLLPNEVVDHINGITDDNRIENLRLYASNKDHLAKTLKGKRPKWSKEGEQNMRRAINKMWRQVHNGERAKFANGRHRKAA